MYPWEHCDEKCIFLKKTSFLNPIRTLSEKFSAFWQSFFGRVGKTPFYVSMRTFRGKINFFEIILSSLLSSSDIERKIFGFLSKIVWRSCQNCILPVQTNMLRFWKNFPKRGKTLLMLDFSVIAIGKHRVKKKRFIWQEDSAFHNFNDMAQNINKIFRLMGAKLRKKDLTGCSERGRSQAEHNRNTMYKD